MLLFRYLFVAMILILAGNASVNAQQITPEATEAAALELSETYQTDDGSLAFDYPAGWTLETAWTGSVPGWRLHARIVRNGESLPDGLGRFESAWLPAGVVVIEVDVYDVESLEFGVRKSGEDITPEDVLRFRMFGLSATPLPPTLPTDLPNNGVILWDIESFTLGDYPAARVDVTNGGKAVGMVIATIENNLSIELSLYTASGESEQWTPTALAIAESINNNGLAHRPEATESPPLPLTEHYVREDGLASFDYPKGWAISVPNQSSGFSALIGSRDTLLYADDDDLFGAGDVQIVVIVWRQTLLNDLHVSNVEELLRWLINMSKNDSSFSAGKIERLNIKDWPAARVYIKPGGQQEGLWIAFQPQDAIYITVGLHTAPGQLAQWQPTVLAIAESITYSG